MLVKMQCPSCGAALDFDDSREFMFCSYCGTKIANIKEEATININQNINQNVNVSGTVVHVRDTSNDPNLYVEYSTLHPEFPLMITFNKERWILSSGEKQQYKLPAGRYVMAFNIAKRKWNREIFIPLDNTPVRIKVVYAKMTSIYIEQPPQGRADWTQVQEMQKQAEKAQRDEALRAEMAQREAEIRAKEDAKAQKAAAKEEKKRLKAERKSGLF